MKVVLFAGEYYYPGGGAEDFVGIYESIEEAKAVYDASANADRWGQIADHATMRVLEETDDDQKWRKQGESTG
jgi:hypothetical protein